jgi:hypothetical protein
LSVAGSGCATFGVPVEAEGLPGVRFGGAGFACAGGCRDPGAGLVYLRARWLDTATGLFLSVGPAESLGGEGCGRAAGNPSRLAGTLGLLPGLAGGTL